MLRGLIVLLAAALAVAGPAVAQTSSRFEGWTSAIIQADWRDGRGEPIQAFDNARRDLIRGFLDAGFSRADMVDYSLKTDSPATVMAGVREAAARTTRGCLIYFTSHGAPDGMVFGDAPRMTPDIMANMVRQGCGARPTVVIISACYSGIFLNALQAPNRMVLTAARRDRPSFGCGADERYPWFDGCVLESLPTACVKRREEAEDLTPGSEPQVSIGANMQFLLPTLRFTPQAPPGGAASTTAAASPASAAARPAG
jgi:hypothetical protein